MTDQLAKLKEQNTKLKIQVQSLERELRSLGVAGWNEIRAQMPREAKSFAYLRSKIPGVTDDTLRRKLKLMERAGMVEKVQMGGSKVGWRPK